MGLCESHLRLPLCQMTETAHQNLREILEEYDLI